MTFNFHIMSERAHKNTMGSFKLNGDTIFLNSTTDKTEFDFKNTKWLVLSPKRILMSNNKSVSKESWSVLEKDKSYEFVPKRVFNELCQVTIKNKMYNLTSYGNEKRHTRRL